MWTLLHVYPTHHPLSYRELSSSSLVLSELHLMFTLPTTPSRTVWTSVTSQIFGAKGMGMVRGFTYLQTTLFTVEGVALT